jgi:hypothetical protein
MPASLSFTLPELNSDVLSVNVNISDSLLQSIVAVVQDIARSREDNESDAEEYRAELEKLVLRSISINRAKFIIDESEPQ